MKYNEDKMRKLIDNDKYLSFMCKDMIRQGLTEREIYKVLYNSEVDNDGTGDYRIDYMELK